MATTRGPQWDDTAAKFIVQYVAADEEQKRRMMAALARRELSNLRGCKTTWGEEEYRTVAFIAQGLREGMTDDAAAIGADLLALLLGQTECDPAAGLDADVWGAFLGGLDIADAPGGAR